MSSICPQSLQSLFDHHKTNASCDVILNAEERLPSPFCLGVGKRIGVAKHAKLLNQKKKKKKKKGVLLREQALLMYPQPYNYDDAASCTRHYGMLSRTTVISLAQ